MTGTFQDGWVVVNEVRAMRTTVYGVKTHYTVAGEGEPIILLHGGGAGGSGEAGWFNAIPALAAHRRVYALDQLGYGLTDKPLMEYSFQALVNHLAGFIDALNLDQVRLVGNSQGAYVGMKYTCDFPERVKQIVTIGSATLAEAMGIHVETSPPVYKNSRESMRNFLSAIVNDEARVTDELIERRFQASQLPGAPEAKASIMRYRQLLKTDEHQRQLFSVEHRVPHLRIPWLVLWGANDKTAPLSAGREVQQRAPNISEFHVVEGAGHQVQNDKPEESNRHLVNFLASDASVLQAASR
jgi:pimeloyl-ACP methyl ester carboxylesterase